MGTLTGHLQQIPISGQATAISAVADIQTAPLGPAPVITKDDGVMLGQLAKQAGDDSNRVVQQLRVQGMADGTFDSRGIGSNLAPPFQSLAGGPADQHPVDPLVGGGLDAADVLLQTGGTGSPVGGQTGETTKTVRVAQVESQLGVGKLMPVFEDGRAQHLFGRKTGSPVAAADTVTQIL